VKVFAKAAHVRGGVLALAAAALVAIAVSATATVAQDAQQSAALRSLWSRGDARFVRAWDLLGPIDGGLEASPVAEERLLGPSSAPVSIGEHTASWMRVASWGDAVDVAGNLSSRERRGSGAAPETAYAFATVSRAAGGAALLSIGSDGGVRVWVNGALVHRDDSTRAFSFDTDRVPVRLNRGENRILVKLVHRTGPWRFALRVLEPGQAVERINEIVPRLNVSGGALVALTDERRSQGAPVSVEAIAAGGRIAARKEAARGESVRFDSSGWPDGAYEVRFTTRDAQGRRAFVHLPWYKGDAKAAAERLIEAGFQSAGRETGLRETRRRLGGAEIVQGQNAREAHVRMLAALALDRVGGDLASAPNDAWAALHSPLMEYEELQMAGGAGAVRPLGFVRLAYVDETDGSTQYCRVYLPADYDPARRWPTVLQLHGYNPPNPPYVRWWSVDSRHDRVAERHAIIWILPHGRGNSQYMGIGEADVLRCLDAARARLSVDDDRVYLMGESMGGSGTWIIGSRHPDRFAAIAPIFGGWDYRVAAGSGVGFNFNNPNATAWPERVTQETQSSFAAAESLLNVPVYVHHGDVDQAVPVDHSRHVVRMMQRWGYNVRYREYPGWAHEDLKTFDEIIEWMLEHRRIVAPPRVRIRSLDLAGASAYWVKVQAFENPGDVEVDAAIVEPGVVRLDTRNVAALSLSPPDRAPPGPQSSARRSLRVIWNGVERAWPVSATGEARLTAPGFRETTLAKRAGLEGGVSRFPTTPFVVVVGTSARDAEMRRLIRDKADIFAELWTQWQHEAPRVMADTEVTPEIERTYSLMLIGGAESNLVAQRMMRRLPVRIDNASVTIDGRRFAAPDSVVQMLYPSPSAANRYVLLVASTSRAGLHFWNPGSLWNQTFGFHTLGFDWTIQDGRRLALESGLGAHRGWVASGVFDRQWRRDDRFVFEGDAALRAQARLRRAPSPGFAPAADSLAPYVGRYQIFPGFVADVARDGAGLIVRVPGSPPDRLIAETENEFALRSTAASVVFPREGGRVSGFVLNNGGQELSGRKLD
jgi:dienelactone hydrolase